MQKNTMYFAKATLYEMIRNCGGVWNDAKERPIVCLIEDDRNRGLYWAIPIGNYDHRNEDAKKRIQYYLDLPESRIESCYYHVGNTTVKSIFFISDAVPITDKYIERGYLGYDGNAYEIKNKQLLDQLNKKLKRILYYEDNNPNHFRQHITDVKEYLMREVP